MIDQDDNLVSVEESDPEDHNQIEEDIMQILVASDINLGYERTVNREEDDSFRTLEEILKYAKDNKVDAIFLAGNLFYESNPPLNVLTKCVNLLRSYCLSQEPVKIECVTDPEWVFSHYSWHKTVNFADENMNIGLPIFSIYGHRDSPSIFDPTGPLDLLAGTGLINYFGKWTVDPRISIPPLFLRKGSTTVALYGLNHINDEKLSTLIKRQKNSKNWKRTVESGIAEHFNSETNKDKLTFLSVEKLNEALSSFKNGNHKVFEQTVRKEIRKSVDSMLDDYVD